MKEVDKETVRNHLPWPDMRIGSISLERKKKLANLPDPERFHQTFEYFGSRWHEKAIAAEKFRDLIYNIIRQKS